MSDHAFSSKLPEEFWSEYSEQPFEACIECDTPLHDGLVPYAVQKHYVAGEAVFEMAICVQCAAQLQEEFSTESRESLIDVIRSAPERRRRQEEADADPPLEATSADDLEEHLEELHRTGSIRREQAMSCCAICAKPRSECHRYSLGTACLGLSLLTAAPDADNLGSPFLICEDCERQLNECISQQTRDAWDQFVEENFDGPPEMAVDPHDLVAIF